MLDPGCNLKEILQTDSYWIVLDTNVLLNIYCYSPQFTEFALNCLKSVEKWVILPATVRFEYGKHCRREFSKMERRVEDAGANARKQIEQSKSKVLSSCNNFERLCFPDVPELRSTIEKGFDDLTISWDGKGLLMEFVFELDKAPKIMPALLQEELYQWCEEGEDRYKNEVPPGFKDAKNKDGIRKYSDFILWKEALRCAALNKKTLSL